MDTGESVVFDLKKQFSEFLRGSDDPEEQLSGLAEVECVGG
jgi:hypothetical protein